MRGPSGVRTLSGWNWTPSIGNAVCRTPITSPSAVRDVTSSSSGTVVAASEVVTADLELVGQAGVDAAAVVRDDARLAVQERLRLPDLATECLHDRLVAEAHAEGRRRRPERGSAPPTRRRVGRPGPGEITSRSGARLTASSVVIASLRTVTTSAPSSSNRCTRL